MRFLSRAETAAMFQGKRVAIVGSGPTVLQNDPGVIDGHDVVVRVNNYRIRPPATGVRTDVFYSFFGRSIRKEKADLIRDGVALCMSKLPNAKPIESAWHERRGQQIGVDYRPHYERRREWWFCDTYVPDVLTFMGKFSLLGHHQPTTGFAAILDILDFNPAEVFLTGFDFFASGVHNVDERWKEKNPDDPIRHRPDLERAWLAENWRRHPVRLDAALADIVA